MGKNNVYENRVSNFTTIKCYIVQVNNVKSLPCFSRHQRGFDVANTSIDENINESDASKGECYIIRYS